MKKLIICFLSLFLFYPNMQGQNLEGIKIYVNPGHGGFDSNDRNVPIPPFALGDTAGFWESKSNLVKGLHLRDLLESAGAEVIMSRTKNRTEDDRPLSAIAEEANVNQVDFMLSIHSNAFNGVTNYVLQLYHGWDNDPLQPQSLDLATLFGQKIISNQTSYWTHPNPVIRGDKSFAPESWNGYGVLRPLTVPGLISEGSFHDYIPETYRLMNREYKHLEAWHFYIAFLEYYNGGKHPTGKISGFVKDNFRKVTDYYSVSNTKDEQLPVNGAKVILNPGNLEYEVDSLNNGFFQFDNLEPGMYNLLVTAEKYIDMFIDSVFVDSSLVNYQLCFLEQDRSDSLEVFDFAPKAEQSETVSAASEIVFHFNFEINRESFEAAFSIEPSAEGTFIYENQDRTAKFVPLLPLEPSTLYSVTLQKNAMHIGGLSMKENFSFIFLTDIKNRLSIVNMYPKNGMTDVYQDTEIRIHFDGRLVNEELTSHIRIEDIAGNVLARSGVELNTFPGEFGSYAFKPANLKADSMYVLKLDAELVDEEGLRLMEDQEIFFTVKEVHESSAPVVIDFEESALSWAVDTAASRNIYVGTGNRLLRYSTAKLFGNYSYRLLYDFSQTDAHVVARPPESIFIVQSGQHAGMYIWGNLSENHLKLLFEKDGQEHEIFLADLDFAGWQFKSCELHFPEEGKDYHFSGFKLISAGTAFSSAGVIFFDNLMIADQPYTSVRNIAIIRETVKIYPNPATSEITAECDFHDDRLPYRITDLSGRTVQQGITAFLGGKTTLQLTYRTRGIYILSFSKDERKVQGLIVIK